MKFIVTCKMQDATLIAKIIPLSKSNLISNIYILRKESGPQINKVKYLILPNVARFKIINIILTPLILIFYTIKLKPNFILAYHFIPHGFFAFITSLFTRNPFIIGQTGNFIQIYSKKPIFGRVVKHIINASFAYNVPGEKSRMFWIEQNVVPKKVNILHSTIDVDHFKPNNLANYHKKYDFLVLSRLSVEKKIDRILLAMNILAEKKIDFKMAIVGDGPEMDTLKKMSFKYNLDNRIDFVGFQSNTLFWFQNSRFFLMYSESEGLPTALMQAMSCGLIPIVTNVGNISDLVMNEINGYLYNFEDFEAYQKRLEIILNMDESCYASLSENARRSVVENHSYASAIVKWEKLLMSQ